MIEVNSQVAVGQRMFRRGFANNNEEAEMMLQDSRMQDEWLEGARWYGEVGR